MSFVYNGNTKGIGYDFTKGKLKVGQEEAFSNDEILGYYYHEEFYIVHTWESAENSEAITVYKQLLENRGNYNMETIMDNDDSKLDFYI